MISAPYARKNGGKTKIAVRAVKAYISKSILPIAWTVTYIIFVPDPQTHGPHGPTCKCTDGHTDGRTDTQKHGRTRRRADGHAEVRMQTQKHRRRRTDADASARWRTDAKYSCVQCVGGKIVQTRPASGRTHKDLRGVLYMLACTHARSYIIYAHTIRANERSNDA